MFGYLDPTTDQVTIISIMYPPVVPAIVLSRTILRGDDGAVSGTPGVWVGIGDEAAPVQWLVRWDLTGAAGPTQWAPPGPWLPFDIAVTPLGSAFVPSGNGVFRFSPTVNCGRPSLRRRVRRADRAKGVAVTAKDTVLAAAGTARLVPDLLTVAYDPCFEFYQSNVGGGMGIAADPNIQRDIVQLEI